MLIALIQMRKLIGLTHLRLYFPGGGRFHLLTPHIPHHPTSHVDTPTVDVVVPKELEVGV